MRSYMLSASTKYALKALRELARAEPGKYVAIDDLSGMAKVPRPYLAKLMKALAEKQIVLTKKGVKGGVMLPQGRKYSFFDICVALDDPVTNQRCLLSNDSCGKGKEVCSMHNAWKKERERLIQFLKDAELG